MYEPLKLTIGAWYKSDCWINAIPFDNQKPKLKNIIQIQSDPEIMILEDIPRGSKLFYSDCVCRTLECFCGDGENENGDCQRCNSKTWCRCYKILTAQGILIMAVCQDSLNDYTQIIPNAL